MLSWARHATRFFQGVAFFRPDSTDTLAHQLERHAQQRPNRVFLRYEDQVFTFAEANAAINRHAHAYRELGVKGNDTVALMIENRPAFLWHLFGLHKIGAVASLVNTNLTGDALLHAFKVCEPSAIIVGSEVWDSVQQVLPALHAHVARMPLVDLDDGASAPSGPEVFNALAAEQSDANPDASLRPRLSDLAAYIYTSGTTGLPKAALVRHHRLYRAGAVWASAALRYKDDDVMYCCLPLYHSNAVLLATGSAITAGVTLALARKFSRTRFWDDVRKHNATHFIYIGELCRYLMNADPSPRDREHRVRVATGNGLRPDIWEAFRDRFGLARVAEFYAATEGNCITLNPGKAVGSVGPMTPGMALARWDEAAQDFVRDGKGFLVKARAGEPGILLGKIRPGFEFDGYRDRKATDQKVMRNVFEPGDAYFNTGDLLRMDRMRRLYFTDRVGDTFRWKGENVSTTEVQEALSKWSPIAEANVYGVQIPGTEGRAGMAAIVLNPGVTLDLAAFKSHVETSLPGYARPLFVRVTSQLATTATFKNKKHDLQMQGFDPNAIDEPLYVRHPQRDAYVPIDAEVYAAITKGALKL